MDEGSSSSRITTNISQPEEDSLDDYLHLIKSKKSKIAINRLPKESDSIHELASECYSGYWNGLFDDAIEELGEISDLIEADENARGKSYPNRVNIFRVFHELPLRKVKVVILGQDPYHQLLDDGNPRAQGLSFSVSEYDDIPVSLKNIFTEIKSCYPNTKFSSGDLSKWLQQGVLLLNTALTVRPSDPDSHTKYWKPFMNYVFDRLSTLNHKVVYMLWGNHAKKYKKLIKSKSALVLESPHPSGLSARKGFFGNKHFRKANEFLDDEIDWSI